MNILYVEGKEFSITASNIIPTVEIIKTSERSINGTMCIDYVTDKLNLEIVWDLVNQKDLDTIKSTFITGETSIRIDYLFDELPAKKRKAAGLPLEKIEKRYYFDAISYAPIILNNTIMWQNVSVKMIED